MNSLNRDRWRDWEEHHECSGIYCNHDWEGEKHYVVGEGDLRTLREEAKAEERKRCLEAVESLKKDPSKEATRCVELSLDYLSASGEALQFFGWNSAIDQTISAINQLNKR